MTFLMSIMKKKKHNRKVRAALRRVFASHKDLSLLVLFVWLGDFSHQPREQEGLGMIGKALLSPSAP